jgi:nucleotide-binding universal stress UspA family protein
MTAVPVTEITSDDTVATDHVGRPELVVGVDGSPPSWDAFAWAAGEARRSNGRILAVYVTPLIEPEEALGSAVPSTYAVAAEARDEVAEELEAEVAKRGTSLGIEVRFVRRIGDAVHELTEVARSVHSDLMVVGRSEKMLHRLAGSVSRRLVLKRDSPVIVVVP